MQAKQIVKGLKSVKPLTLKFEGNGRRQPVRAKRSVKVYEVTLKDGAMTISGKSGALVIDSVTGDDFTGRFQVESFEIFQFLDGNEVVLSIADGALSGQAGNCKFTFTPLDPQKIVRSMMIETPALIEVRFDGLRYIKKVTPDYRSFEIYSF